MREQRDNGDTRVTTGNGDLGILGVDTGNRANKARGTDHVEGGNTIYLFGVKLASFLEDLGDNGDGRVDGVGDDEDVGIWCSLCNCLGKVSDDGCIGLQTGSNVTKKKGRAHIEEIISGHLSMVRT